MQTNKDRTVEVVPEDYSYVFNPYREPIATVKPGERVTIHTDDAFESRITNEGRSPEPCPCHGQVPQSPDRTHLRAGSRTWRHPSRSHRGHRAYTRLRRQRPDTLLRRSYLDELHPHTTGAAAREGLDLGPRRRRHQPCQRGTQCGTAWEPFLGTLAVAPDLEAITALSPGPFGGNMDVPDVKPGNTVYLPVWNSGALVYTGDCHARQGQGELCGVALEITSKVTVVFEVIKDKAIEWPRIESDEAIMVVGSARPMEDAARIANTELVSVVGAGIRLRSLGCLPIAHPGRRFVRGQHGRHHLFPGGLRCQEASGSYAVENVVDR